MLICKIFPIIFNYWAGLLLVEKREPAELGRMETAFIPPFVHLWAGPPTHSMLILLFTTLADILGSFIIKKLLNITVFLPHKRPNILNVLT